MTDYRKGPGDRLDPNTWKIVVGFALVYFVAWLAEGMPPVVWVAYPNSSTGP